VPKVEYRSNRWEIDESDEAQTSMLPVIDYHFAGPLSIEGNLFAFHSTTDVRMHPAAPASLTLAHNRFFDHQGYINNLDTDVVDVSTNVSVERYGNQFGVRENGVYFTDHGQPQFLLPPLPNPPTPGPSLVSGPLPPPKNVELQMKTSVYKVTDFGAVPNDMGDDTLAFQKALIKAIDHPQGGIVYAPSGVYRISSSLVLDSFKMIKFRGDGSSNTILEWHGRQDDVPLFLLDAQRDSIFAYFSIRSTANHHLHTGILSKTQDPPPPYRNATLLSFYDVIIDGRAGSLDFGWRIAPGCNIKGCNDNNNEHHYFVESKVLNYNEAGWSIEHRQSKSHLFINSFFDGGDGGLYGVATTYGLGLGSYNWLGGGGMRNQIADFALGGSNDFILIRDGRFRGSRRFLEAGQAESAWNINLYRNYWGTSTLDTSGHIIHYRKAGPLVLKGNVFELFKISSPNAFIWHYSLHPTVLTAIGNEFRWPGSESSAHIITDGPYSGIGTDTFWRTLRGNIYYDLSFSPIVRPYELPDIL
jgi:hypothetical protein